MPCLPWFIGHVLAEVCEEDGDIETDFFGRVQEGGGELGVVNVALVVRLAAHQKEVDLVCGVPSRVTNYDQEMGDVQVSRQSAFY